ncbi:DUF2889 domain-containing protein [Govanella unica]|uniref:DUF2889 domain-containing protein n=1 Tax=Govanella unica TaxID=2975056 RepID=A0A9X3TZG5_9PROT|nr:DUF2889 domain-containing protein [Govania unica]MDA5194304.1 DUF2889 domain-containing protein [Govania unica]
MPLSVPAVAREKFHTRRITCEGYARADGLWDIEAHMTDVKSYAFMNTWRGDVLPGTPIHEMWLRLTIDDGFKIIDVEAQTDNSPYEVCPAITINFKRLIGLTIGAGWNRKAKGLVGGVEGCTHLVELLGPMATVAFQTILGSAKQRRDEKFGLESPENPETDESRAKMIVNTCHAMSSRGEIVRGIAPELYTGDEPEPAGPRLPLPS